MRKSEIIIGIHFKIHGFWKADDKIDIIEGLLVLEFEKLNCRALK
jgi:hypothetical protein